MRQQVLNSLAQLLLIFCVLVSLLQLEAWIEIIGHREAGIVVILGFPFSPSLGSLSGPHPASRTPPKAGWPGQVEGVGSGKAKITSWRRQGPSSRLLPGDLGMCPELPLPHFAPTAVLEFGLRKSLWTWQWPNWPRVAHQPRLRCSIAEQG